MSDRSHSLSSLVLAALGFWVVEPYQGKGAATQAIAELIAFAFARGREKLEALVFVGNHASRRALEKNGFQLEGTLRCAVRKRGVYVDEWLLGITRADYRR
jgi:[ribosomal protein S5]-alanine N-acetyltransferase